MVQATYRPVRKNTTYARYTDRERRAKNTSHSSCRRRARCTGSTPSRRMHAADSTQRRPPGSTSHKGNYTSPMSHSITEHLISHPLKIQERKPQKLENEGPFTNRQTPYFIATTSCQNRLKPVKFATFTSIKHNIKYRKRKNYTKKITAQAVYQTTSLRPNSLCSVPSLCKFYNVTFHRFNTIFCFYINCSFLAAVCLMSRI